MATIKTKVVFNFSEPHAGNEQLAAESILQPPFYEGKVIKVEQTFRVNGCLESEPSLLCKEMTESGDV